MGRGTAWKAHDVDMVRGWMAAGKTTTAMAKLRPDWPWSSIKKLVARLRAPGGETAHVFADPVISHPLSYPFITLGSHWIAAPHKTDTTCLYARHVFFFFSHVHGLFFFLQGPYLEERQKRKVFNFHFLGPCRFFGEKVMFLK